MPPSQMSARPDAVISTFFTFAAIPAFLTTAPRKWSTGGIDCGDLVARTVEREAVRHEDRVIGLAVGE